MAKDFSSREENYAQWYNDLVLKADLPRRGVYVGSLQMQCKWSGRITKASIVKG